MNPTETTPETETRLTFRVCFKPASGGEPFMVWGETEHKPLAEEWLKTVRNIYDDSWADSVVTTREIVRMDW
jgi:hypothetical protein